MPPARDMSEDSRHPQARVGSTLGGWRLESLLGSGGTSAVYAASDAHGARAAIKVLHRELAGDRACERLVREAMVANLLADEGGVRILDHGADGGDHFLVMELLEGQTLAARAAAAGGRLSLDEVLRVAMEVLRILAAAHARGIVHRDVKPENIFLVAGGEVRILDFGLARVHESATASAALTGSGAMLGTPAFMSPEQALGRSREVDARTDVWCASATLFTLLTGRPVHEAETVGEAIVMAGSLAAPAVAARAPGLPRAVATVMDRALAFRNRDRFPDAGAMRRALLRAITRGESAEVPALAQPLGATVPEPSDSAAADRAEHPAKIPPGSVRDRRGRWVGAAFAAVLLGLALLPAKCFGVAASTETAPAPGTPPASATSSGRSPEGPPGAATLRPPRG
jgi:serine/threonine protein kinase